MRRKFLIEFALEKRVDVIGLENLNGIRKRTKVRKKQRHDFESWVYRKLQFMIEYKAKERGILVVYVDPKHTSITCPRCYHVNKANRNGKLFQCKACGYTLNADLVGARNPNIPSRDKPRPLGGVVDVKPNLPIQELPCWKSTRKESHQLPHNSEKLLY